MKDSIALFNNFLKYSYNLSNKNMGIYTDKKIKNLLIDYFAVTFSGYYSYMDKISEYIGSTENNHKIFKKIESLNTLKRAFILGVSAHALDMDDGANDGIIHLGSPIFSAIFSLYNDYKFNWENFKYAVLIGYEITLKISQAIQPSHKYNGFHSTGTCGTIGAAAAAAIIMGLNYNQFINSIYIAASSASGLLKVIEGDSHLKAVNVGRAAMNGVNSALLSKAGFISPTDFFFGNNGFFNVFANEVDFKKLLNRSEDELAIHKVYCKKFAACRYCHPAIDIALIMRDSISNLESIKEINIYTYKVAIKNHDHIQIKGVTSAKMSIPYSFTIALINGTASIMDFDEENITNVQLKKLLEKIKVIENPEFTDMFPKKTPACVEIIYNNNQSLTHTVYVPKGEPENPLTDIELYDKFFELLRYANVDENKIKKLYQYLYNEQINVDYLFDLLVQI